MNSPEPLSPVGMAPPNIHNFMYYGLSCNYILDYIKTQFKNFNFVCTHPETNRHRYIFVKDSINIECIIYKSKRDVRELLVTFTCLNTYYNYDFLKIIKEFRNLHISDPSLNDASKDMNMDIIDLVCKYY